MNFDDAKKDPILLDLLKKFMTASLCLENYAFLMSKDSNEKDMNDGAKYFTAAAANLKSKGVPGDREEVNRMFDSGRMRHDKVHNAFTTLLQKDKAFTRGNFATVFTKKDAYSKMWMEYRK